MFLLGLLLGTVILPIDLVWFCYFCHPEPPAVACDAGSDGVCFISLRPQLGHDCFDHVSLSYSAVPKTSTPVDSCIDFQKRVSALWLRMFGQSVCWSQWAPFGGGYGLKLLDCPLLEFCRTVQYYMIPLFFDTSPFNRDLHCSNSFEIIEDESE